MCYDRIRETSIQCFEKNTCVKEEKSYSFPDCREPDETDDAVCLPVPEGGILSFLGALAPTTYVLEHNYKRLGILVKISTISQDISLPNSNKILAHWLKIN